MSLWDALKRVLFGGAAATRPPAWPAPSAPPPAAQPWTEVAAQNPYEASEILGLSPDELRKRALKIDPYKTAWIGRVDTIPPQSDERTALIDRGLILRGLLTEQQIGEIHRVGDIWLRHHEAVKLAESAAAKSVEAALEAEQQRKAALKAQKKQESAERKARLVAEVAERRRADIIYLGPGVSAGLKDRRSLVERLTERDLPVLSTPADLAHALGIAIPELRWLAFHSEALERPHYVYFEVPKRSGGMRLLAAPHAKLAQAQQWILARVLEQLPVETEAHGFVKGRSTVTNAAPHVGRDVVINLDLSDFFPSITFKRVRGVFRKLGYSEAVATIMALLCTEAPRRAVEYDGRRYWVAVGERALPQGACTSPALSNQIARKLDRRLRGMCARHGWSYTRYADDLSFSAPPEKTGEAPMLLARVRHIVEAEGFKINPRKGRVQRASSRQAVTGIVVNKRLALPREEARRLRAILHGAREVGLAAQNREGIPHFEAWLRGKIAYLAMVDRPRGLAYLKQLDEIVSSPRA
jgi:RNA-directed DNA polymerase